MSDSLRRSLKRLGRVLLSGAISGTLVALIPFLKETTVVILGTEMPIIAFAGTALLNAFGKWLREKGISVPIPF